jgi:hypothetical protein
MRGEVLLAGQAESSAIFICLWGAICTAAGATLGAALGQLYTGNDHALVVASLIGGSAASIAGWHFLIRGAAADEREANSVR